MFEESQEIEGPIVLGDWELREHQAHGLRCDLALPHGFGIWRDEAPADGVAVADNVVQAVKEEAVQRLNASVTSAAIEAKAVPDETVRKYYENNASQFHRPAMRRARHILLDSKEQAQTLLKQAKAADERGFHATG